MVPDSSCKKKKQSMQAGQPFTLLRLHWIWWCNHLAPKRTNVILCNKMSLKTFILKKRFRLREDHKCVASHGQVCSLGADGWTEKDNDLNQEPGYCFIFKNRRGWGECDIHSIPTTRGYVQTKRRKKNELDLSLCPFTALRTRVNSPIYLNVLSWPNCRLVLYLQKFPLGKQCPV